MTEFIFRTLSPEERQTLGKKWFEHHPDVGDNFCSIREHEFELVIGLKCHVKISHLVICILKIHKLIIAKLTDTCRRIFIEIGSLSNILISYA